MRKWSIVALTAFVAGAHAAIPAAQQSTDFQRAAKLASAFNEIDALFTEFAKASRVPGAAWGVIVDRRLVHSGATGVRDVASRAAVKTSP